MNKLFSRLMSAYSARRYVVSVEDLPSFDREQKNWLDNLQHRCGANGDLFDASVQKLDEVRQCVRREYIAKTIQLKVPRNTITFGNDQKLCSKLHEGLGRRIDDWKRWSSFFEEFDFLKDDVGFSDVEWIPLVGPGLPKLNIKQAREFGDAAGIRVFEYKFPHSERPVLVAMVYMQEDLGTDIETSAYVLRRDVQLEKNGQLSLDIINKISELRNVSPSGVKDSTIVQTRVHEIPDNLTEKKLGKVVFNRAAWCADCKLEIDAFVFESELYFVIATDPYFGNVVVMKLDNYKGDNSGVEVECVFSASTGKETKQNWTDRIFFKPAD